MRSTLYDAKQPSSGISRVLNLSPTDSRFTGYVNEAIQRLVQTGEMFWGLYARYQFCLDNGCLVWPREIAAIEAISICNQAITVRNGWFEFLENAPGLMGDGQCNNSCSCGPSQLFDRGTTVAFADIIGDDKIIRVYADVPEADGAVILLQGYDENGNWIRSEPNGPGNGWIDGERVAILHTYADSLHIFSSLAGVQKPVTNGVVRLYERDTVNLTQRAIAVYEPDETRPNYRKSFVNNMPQNTGTCGTTQVTVMAKLEFIPVRNDPDWLLIGNLPALKDECQSILKFEANLAEEGAFWHAKAVAGLRAELRHYVGHGVVQPIRMQPRSIAGGAVANML